MSPQASIERFILDELLLGSRTTIESDESLLASGVVDSLALLRLIGFIEEHFGVVIEDHEVAPENFESINVMTALVESKR